MEKEKAEVRTMDEYIEKHKAVNLLTALENEFQQFKPFKGFEHAMYRKLCETEIAIGKLPAADVVPMVHGKWISFLDGDHIMPERYYRCSRCGRVESRRQPYCHCGAKMDGAE
jgi:hypothetical protein